MYPIAIQQRLSETESRTMNKAMELQDLLASAPRECWLALNEDKSRIVGRGETLEEAVKEARQNGVDDPIVFWAPKSWIPAVY